MVYLILIILIKNCVKKCTTETVMPKGPVYDNPWIRRE